MPDLSVAAAAPRSSLHSGLFVLIQWAWSYVTFARGALDH
jgi:hypothetical protein